MDVTTQALSPVKRFILVRIFPWIVVLVGASAMGLGVENTLRARSSLAWPSVEGRITSASVERKSSPSTTRQGSSDSITYRPQIVYAYAVEGTSYTGERISYGGYATSDPADARRVVERYPEGRAVRVYYMPERHGECVLEPGMAGVPWLLLALGLVFSGAGIAMVLLLPRLVARAR
jgi:hypothetical protein